ncbi:glycosyltransferase [Aquirhabdus sp.]|uniref:glycosyltransferase n=1 Tax=Aquirhabdus sp. TaxID=2824160 RepID=UPI00396C3EA2
MVKEIASSYKQKKLFVDVSEIIKSDARTGIQRVVRSLVRALFANPPTGYQIVLIYTSDQWQGYKIASAYMLSFSNCSGTTTKDSFIKVNEGDVFLGLDLYFDVIHQHAFFARLRQRGVRIYFLLHDLLPIHMPHMFGAGMQNTFSIWLNFISQMDGVICVSQTVADEYLRWLHAHQPKRFSYPLNIGWSHNGADLESSMPTKGLPDNIAELLEKMKTRPTFLTVGTIEPRKGVMQIFQAFELLWKLGLDVNFVLVGKQGWNVESLVKILREAEHIKNFVWLESISDECLDMVYDHTTCLIAASLGEGFGLPLIEAAKHKIPIIAKSLPIFKEVAGEHAYYFSGNTPDALASCIHDWLELENPPQSEHIPWISWKKSTNNLKKIIFEDHWYKTWSPYNVLSNKISDHLSCTAKDQRIDRSIESANVFEGVMKKIGIVIVVNHINPVDLFHSIQHADHQITWYLYHPDKNQYHDDMTDVPHNQTTIHNELVNGNPISGWNEGIHASFLDENDMTLVIDEDVRFTLEGLLRFIDFVSKSDSLQIAFLVGDKLEDGKRIVKSLDFSCFAIKRAVVEQLGYFDENFASLHYAAIDYTTRIQKSALVSTCIMDDGIAARQHHPVEPIHQKHQEKIRQAERTNQAYYYKKWGLGPVESDKVFQTPFNSTDYGAHITWDSRKNIYGGINRWIPHKAKFFFGGDFKSLVGVKELGFAGLHYVRSGRKAGFLAFGPYIPIKHGRYEVSIYGMWPDMSADLAWVDIAYDKGRKIVFKEKLNEIVVQKNRVARFQFLLEEDCDNLEIRLYVDNKAYMLLAFVELIEIKPKKTKAIKVEKPENQPVVNA